MGNNICTVHKADTHLQVLHDRWNDAKQSVKYENGRPVLTSVLHHLTTRCPPHYPAVIVKMIVLQV